MKEELEYRKVMIDAVLSTVDKLTEEGFEFSDALDYIDKIGFNPQPLDVRQKDNLTI